MEILKRKILDIDVNSLRNPVCLQGMPGIALAGKTAVDHIIKFSKAKKFMEVGYADFPPNVVVEGDGKVRTAQCEFYIWRNNHINRDFILLTSDWQPTTITGMNELSAYITDILNELRVEMIIALAASPISMPKRNPAVFLTATSEEVIKLLKSKDKNLVPLTDGVITGMNGLVPVLAKIFYGIDGAILLGEAAQRLNRWLAISKDPSASKALIESLNKIFDLHIDTSPLDKEIEKMFRLLHEIKERAVKRVETGKKEEKREPEYIG